jgi:hypothetical protein
MTTSNTRSVLKNARASGNTSTFNGQECKLK